MNRSPMPPRRAPLARRSLARKAKPAPKVRYTGPTSKVRQIVRDRASGRCEWPDCRRPGTDYHHRLNRKMGGRKGQRAEEINQASWLVLACREHHDDVTSSHGERRQLALDCGWLLLENETACEVPIAMDGGAYYLDDEGGKEPVDGREVPL